MRLRHVPCLTAVVLTLYGCAHSKPPLPRPIPPLDQSLAQPCPSIPDPGAPSYDAWQEWIQGVVLPSYADCAARHAATVNAWPR
jgi:hypothetical protein